MTSSDQSYIPEALRLDLPDVYQAIRDFIQSEVQLAGLKKAVVGVSGGIDSALTLFLTVSALGAENVLGVMMPYRTSNPDSLSDAEKAVKAAGCRSCVVDISPMADPYFDDITDEERLRKGNVLARMRMIVLYDLSAKEQGLVIGTGNKTELLLGYATLHGDAACACEPLGDLYKTQVSALAVLAGVPEEIINKPPSADLWVGQTDEEELGITYADADRLLLQMVDFHIHPARLIEKGEDEKAVNNLVNRYRQSQFKRSSPMIPKITSNHIDSDNFSSGAWKISL
ncbi:MAG: NAD+ synthase [Candidatus Electryonea clarkiae]|nr:NAD+ synthase [Candidatus Electryonea clarkiae]MDP8285531.1 NAD+ synthase [Candidatus Electryonea clarkiae]